MKAAALRLMVLLMVQICLTSAGCPTGMFSLLASKKCFKRSNKRMAWSAAANHCATEGLVFSRPSDDIALALRNYLLYTLGGDYHVWIGGRGDGRSQAWERDGSAVNPNLLWPGAENEFTNDRCLSLYVFADGVRHPRRPYTTYFCHDTRRVLCEDSATKTPVAPEVPGPDISTKPSTDVTNQDEAKCGLSSSFDERVGSGHVDITEKIVGGQEAIAGKYPWMVHMSFYSSFFDDILSCGGSLVSKRWVLTAAHCIKHLKRNIAVYVRIGYVNLKQQKPQSELFSIYLDDVITHGDFNNSTLENDIALVRLPQDVNFNTAIRPICLADNEMIPFGGKAVAAGWGLLDSGDTEIPDILREVQLDVLAENSCENSQLFICTSTAGKDTCKGDSGGPLMVQHGRQWFAIGIVSHGPTNCGSSNIPGVYTRVPNYHAFISSHINL